jgi:hypothetical protein
VREKKTKEMDEDEGGMMNDTDSNWAQCEFLIIKEVSMLGCQKLAKISKALIRLMGINLPFGGLSVLSVAISINCRRLEIEHSIFRHLQPDRKNQSHIQCIAKAITFGGT